MKNDKHLTVSEIDKLLRVLEERFNKNKHRHQALYWEDVHAKLKNSSEKLWSLNEMERSGGEPDVVGYDKSSNTFIFFDCSKESPSGRRSICFDQQALESRKQYKPENSATAMAEYMGIELLNEAQYQELQKLGDFDTKTSSWIKTPDEIRKLGGALFADKRYNTVFVYHNGAESYYAARGFRGVLSV